MFGLEEKDKKARFLFELEKRLKTEAGYEKSLQEKAEKRIHEIKNALRKGADEKDFDRLGILLHGYAALQKIIKKAAK